MSVRVSYVIVSHSASLANGVCELAAQMAPDVHFEAAGGTDDGRIGTSYDLVEAALEAAAAAVEGEGSGVVGEPHQPVRLLPEHGHGVVVQGS